MKSWRGLGKAAFLLTDGTLSPSRAYCAKGKLQLCNIKKNLPFSLPKEAASLTHKSISLCPAYHRDHITAKFGKYYGKSHNIQSTLMNFQFFSFPSPCIDLFRYLHLHLSLEKSDSPWQDSYYTVLTKQKCCMKKENNPVLMTRGTSCRRLRSPCLPTHT